MPKVTKPPRYRLRGESPGNVKGIHKRAMIAVACSYCRAAKGWQCTSITNGRPSSEAHRARLDAYAVLDSGASPG